jgi:hypothetical protein
LELWSMCLFTFSSRWYRILTLNFLYQCLQKPLSRCGSKDSVEERVSDEDSGKATLTSSNIVLLYNKFIFGRWRRWLWWHC